MAEWVLVCNAKEFDFENVFYEKDVVNCLQTVKVLVGDFVYLYVGSPVNAILYKCEVSAICMDSLENYGDKCDIYGYAQMQSDVYMRLKLIQTYPRDMFSYEKLKNHGLESIQMSFQAGPELSSYLKSEGRIKHVSSSGMMAGTEAGKHRIIIVNGMLLTMLLIVCALWGNINSCGRVVPSETEESSEASAVIETNSIAETAESEQMAESGETAETTEEKSEESTSAGTSGKTYGELAILCQSRTILAGDAIRLYLKSGTWFINGESAGIEWSSNDSEIASINEKGILQAVAAGKCNITASYEGQTVSVQIEVVELDTHTGAKISVDYESLSMNTYGSDTVRLTLSGNMPKKVSGLAYCTSGINLSLEWGKLENNQVTLTAKDLYSDEGEGKITILIYDSDETNHIVAELKLRVKIRK